MSFCYDCADKGYTICFCRPIKQPEIKFVSEIDTIKKLQEQNKIMREALEFYSVSGKYHYGEYRKNGEWSFNPPSISDDCGETAREALAKVKE